MKTNSRATSTSTTTSTVNPTTAAWWNGLTPAFIRGLRPPGSNSPAAASRRENGVDLLPRLKPWDPGRGGHPGDAAPAGEFPLAGTPGRGHRVGPVCGVWRVRPPTDGWAVSTAGDRSPSVRPRPRAGPSTRHAAIGGGVSQAGAELLFVCPCGPRCRPRGNGVVAFRQSGLTPIQQPCFRRLAYRFIPFPSC